MEYRIEWTEPAQQQLYAIWLYITASDPRAADRLRDRILAQVALLAAVPLLGQRYDGPVSGHVRHMVVKSYRVFYQVDESRDQVEILAVWHSARLDPDLDLG